MKRMKAFIALIFALSSSFVYSQDIDSLYAIFSASTGVTRFNVAEEIMKYSNENDFLDNPVTLKPSDDETYVNMNIHEFMGYFLSFEKGDYSESNDFHKMALEHCEKLQVETLYFIKHK